MTQAAVFAAQANAQELRRVISKLQGYPKVGTHVGNGRHVPMPASWDGTGNCPPGWTQHTMRLLAHTNGTNYAVEVSAQVVTDAANPVLQAILTAGELTTLSTGVAAAVTLDATWDTATPLANAAQAGGLAIADEHRP